MSTINRDNRREKIAYVALFATEGASKIEVLHGNIKEIRVYISTNPMIPTMQFYRQSLLQLFIHLIEGYRVPRLESNSDVSQDIVRLFINICSQSDAGKSIRSIVDDTGRPIINSDTKITVFASENRLVAETDVRLPVQNLSRQNTNVEEDFPSLEELELQRRQRQEREIQQNQRRQQQETVRRGINELFGLLGPDGRNEEQVGQVLAEVGHILTGTARPNQVPATDYVRATADRRRQNSGSQNPLYPVVNALPFPINLLAAVRPSVQPTLPAEDSPFLEPLIRNLADPQPNIIPNTNNPQPNMVPNIIPNIQTNAQVRPIQPIRRQDESDESEIPSRFVENHNGVRREIFPDEKNNDINTPSLVANQPTETIVHPSHTVPIRNPISSELIQKIASNVYELIKTGKTRPPDFKSKTKSALTRIKNYIHNISRVWLSQTEIELFVSELTKLQSST